MSLLKIGTVLKYYGRLATVVGITNRGGERYYFLQMMDDRSIALLPADALEEK